MIDLSEFYSDDSDEIVKELRKAVSSYKTAKERADTATKLMKKEKDHIEKLFVKLPDSFKIITKEKPRTVGKTIFSIIKKTINIDNYVIILRERINTKLDREALFKWFTDYRKELHTEEELIVLRKVVEHVEDSLNPSKSSYLTIEPVKKKKGI